MDIISKIFLFIVSAPLIVIGLSTLLLVTFFDQFGLYVTFFFYVFGLFKNRKNTAYIEYVVVGAIISVIVFLMNYFPIFEPDFLFSSIGIPKDAKLSEMDQLLYNIFDFSSHSYAAANLFRGTLNAIFTTLMIYITNGYGDKESFGIKIECQSEK